MKVLKEPEENTESCGRKRTAAQVKDGTKKERLLVGDYWK